MRPQVRSLFQRCLLIIIDPVYYTKSQSSRSNIFNASATFLPSRIANHPILLIAQGLFFVLTFWRELWYVKARTYSKYQVPYARGAREQFRKTLVWSHLGQDSSKIQYIANKKCSYFWWYRTVMADLTRGFRIVEYIRKCNFYYFPKFIVLSIIRSLHAQNNRIATSQIKIITEKNQFQI